MTASGDGAGAGFMVSGKDDNYREGVVVCCGDAFAEGLDGNLGDATAGVLGHHVVCEAEFDFGDTLDIEHLEGGNDGTGAEGRGEAEGGLAGFDAAATATAAAA